ncbi:MAG: hypothetical protein Q4D47_04620 [Erysipelotrichaceae bacterium]|nr:hypothetical protein [Erysipelotrichaceae bacterium]
MRVSGLRVMLNSLIGFDLRNGNLTDDNLDGIALLINETLLSIEQDIKENVKSTSKETK